MKEKLSKYNQEHLILYYDKLSNEQKEKFEKDINSINFEFLNELIKNDNQGNVLNNISPIKSVDKSDLLKENKYELIGKKLVENGKLALITMAGGQGTRLGFNGPKGCYILKDKSLFEIFADKIKNYNIPWLIMTSEENDKETRDFFEINNNFNLENVIFFKQRMLPVVDESGKILVSETGFIKMGADGSGGVYNALKENNLIYYLEKIGVKYVFINGVDNCLTNPVDFHFLGMAEDQDYHLACKSVEKSNPEEKVGVFCYNNNKPFVIEYIHLSEELRYLKDKYNNLVYKDSHILSNLLSIDLLKKIENKRLNYYKAHKKINYITLDGEIVKPIVPNAYKFESFLFDSFKYADDFLIVNVNREDEFAPLKNSDEVGVDCPKTALKLLENYQKSKNDFTK